MSTKTATPIAVTVPTRDKSVTSEKPVNAKEYFAYRALGATVWTYCTDVSQLSLYLFGDYEIQIVKDEIARTIGKKREVSKRSGNYDQKFGSVGIVNTQMYDLHYGKSSRNKNSVVAVLGSDLQFKVNELYRLGNKSFMIAKPSANGEKITFADLPHYSMLYPEHLNEEREKIHGRKQYSARNDDVAPIIDSSVETEKRVISLGTVNIEGYQSKKWFIFNVTNNGQSPFDDKLSGTERNQRAYALVGEWLSDDKWGGTMRKEFGCGPASMLFDGKLQFALKTPSKLVTVDAIRQLFVVGKPVQQLSAKLVAVNGEKYNPNPIKFDTAWGIDATPDTPATPAIEVATNEDPVNVALIALIEKLINEGKDAMAEKLMEKL